MPRYWLDANVFIEANNGYWSLTMNPPFWVWLETNLNKGEFCSSSEVYREIIKKDDVLKTWATSRRGAKYWPEPKGAVQDAGIEINNYVIQRYAQANPAIVGEFLAYGDPWIIAHAKVGGGTVVTGEKRISKVNDNDPKAPPKIPNVCDHYGVRCISMLDMLKELSFSIEGIASSKLEDVKKKKK